jgi:hypothetical protein
MALDLLVATCLTGFIATPHVAPLHRVAPVSAAAVWVLALCLRALVASATAVYMLVYLPQSPHFVGAADWCLHAALPVASIHFHVPGLRVAHGIAVIPALALAASMGWAGFELLRARLYALRLVRRSAIGTGPMGSTILASEELVVAVTRVGPARLLVSGPALLTFDDEELTAGLQHELGHLRRAHRPILFVASVLRALARWLPGTATAYRELCFSLERDADEYALRQTHNLLALASAICKTAMAQTQAAPVMGLRGQSGTTLRLEYLLAGGCQRAGTRVERATRLLATLMLAVTLFLAIAAPVWAMARPGTLPHIPGSAGWNCP